MYKTFLPEMLRGPDSITFYLVCNFDLVYSYKSPAAKISCVVSLGCGIYPPEPLGNTDIADVLKITKLLSAPRRLDDLLTLFTTAVY